MALIRWSPFFDQFDEMEKRVLSNFPALRSGAEAFMPAIDVYETKDAVMVESALAGVDPENVDIAIENNVLTLRGETKKEQEIEEKDYYRKEVRHGSFYREVALPCPVEGEKAEATFEKGMLKIQIPKRAEAQKKTIKVNFKK